MQLVLLPAFPALARLIAIMGIVYEFSVSNEAMLHGTVDAIGIQKSCSVIDVRSTRRNSYKLLVQLTTLTTVSIFESKLGAWIQHRHAPACLFGLA